MILHAARVRSWRRLASVDLSFAPGVNVIYGPNRTGKTSLVEAVRAALVDYQFSSTKAEPAVPWGSDSIPEVEIEFEVAAVPEGDEAGWYRLTKAFSKRQAGGAALHRRAGEEWRKVDSGRSVLDRVRRLLGVDASSSGIAALLWVPQGAADVPAVDGPLRDRLQPILASVVSGQDMAFRSELAERTRQWFTRDDTARAGDHRRKSPLREVEERLAESEQAVGELADEYGDIEDRLRELSDTEQQIVKAEGAVRVACEEVAQLEGTQSLVEQKRQTYSELAGQEEQARGELGRLETDREALNKHRQTTAKLEEKIGTAQQELDGLERQHGEAKKRADEAREVRQQAHRLLRKLTDDRELVEAKALLAQLHRDREAAERQQRRVDELRGKIKKLTDERDQIPAVKTQQIEGVEGHLERSRELDAELRASRLNVLVEADEDVDVGLELDGEAHVYPRQPRAPVERAVLRSVQVEFAGVGRVSVARGAEDCAVDALAEERDDIDRGLRSALVPWGLVAVDNNQIVSTLRGWQAERGALGKSIKRLRDQLTSETPDGDGIAEGQLAQITTERTHVLEAHPQLAEWEPTVEAAAKARAALQKQERVRGKALEEAERAEAKAATKRDKLSDQLTELREGIQGLEGDLRGPEALTKRITDDRGSDEEIDAAIARKTKALESLRQDVAKHALTESEQAVGEGLEQARSAQARRDKRLGDLRVRAGELRGQLRDTEGLQAKRAAAEQRLEELRRQRESIELEAAAHSLLLRLFDDARARSTEAALEPVALQVDSWLTELYGPDHLRVVFGENLDVTGVNTSGVEEAKVEAATSYGEREQLSTLVRLAYGICLAQKEPQVVILDDPLAHSDAALHRRMLDVIQDASRQRLQIIVLTCHAERFDHLREARMVDLQAELRRRPTGESG